MTDKTGGSAFPRSLYKQGGSFDSSSISQGYGMTLRDYFAAKAMQEFVGVCNYKEGAIRAYKWADAMLKERNND
jgi:hypothetical protein